MGGIHTKPIRKRFDEMIGLLTKLRLWDKLIEEINCLLPTFTSGYKGKLKQLLSASRKNSLAVRRCKI